MSAEITSLMGLGVPGALASKISQMFIDNQELQKEVNIASGLGEYLPYNTLSTSYDSTYRVRVNIGTSATNLRLWFANTKVSGSGETAAANAITIGASLQLAATDGTPTGNTIPLRFLGNATYSLGASGVIATDPIGITVTAGQKLYILTYVNISSAELGRNRFANVVQSFSGEGIGSGNQTVTISSIPSATSGGNIYAPFAMTGIVVEPEKKSLYLIGDSNSTQFYDRGVGTLGQGGWVARACAGNAALVNAAVGGDKLSNWVAASGVYQRIAQIPRGASCLIAMGTNDLGTKTVAEMQADYATIVSQLEKFGVDKVSVATILPRTTSTDAWTTTANQTKASTESDRLTLNDWMRTMQGSLFYQALDVCTPIESSTGVWNVDATPLVSDTFTTGSTTTALNPTTALSANNAVVGKVVRVTSGAVSGGISVIQYHTTTVITLLTALGGSPANGDSFQVLNTYTWDGIHLTTRGCETLAAAIDINKVL